MTVSDVPRIAPAGDVAGDDVVVEREDIDAFVVQPLPRAAPVAGHEIVRVHVTRRQLHLHLRLEDRTIGARDGFLRAGRAHERNLKQKREAVSVHAMLQTESRPRRDVACTQGLIVSKTFMAALCPGMPLTAPPRCALEPQMKTFSHSVSTPHVPACASSAANGQEGAS